jgi:hypothetical protein
MIISMVTTLLLCWILWQFSNKAEFTELLKKTEQAIPEDPLQRQSLTRSNKLYGSGVPLVKLISSSEAVLDLTIWHKFVRAHNGITSTTSESILMISDDETNPHLSTTEKQT